MRKEKTINTSKNGDIRKTTKFAFFPHWLCEYISDHVDKESFIWLERYVVTEKYFNGRWFYWALGNLT